MIFPETEKRINESPLVGAPETRPLEVTGRRILLAATAAIAASQGYGEDRPLYYYSITSRDVSAEYRRTTTRPYYEGLMGLILRSTEQTQMSGIAVLMRRDGMYMSLDHSDDAEQTSTIAHINANGSTVNSYFNGHHVESAYLTGGTAGHFYDAVLERVDALEVILR